jgi:myotubularin-related protein 1/2
VLVDHKFVRCKLVDGKYEDVTFILSDYQIFIKTKYSLVHFPLGKVEKLHKYMNKENNYKLLICLKDGRVFKFIINTETMWKKIYDWIERFAFVRVKRHFFAFRHFDANKQLEDTSIGWKVYDLVREFNRMEVELMPHTENPVTDYWSDFKILDNRDGKICSTYPEKIIVPSRIPYDSLVRCSKFRSRSRMPALTFLYHYDNDSYSCLYRSSQSKVGVSNSRSPDDELMLRYIGNPQYDPKGIFRVIKRGTRRRSTV